MAVTLKTPLGHLSERSKCHEVETQLLTKQDKWPCSNSIIHDKTLKKKGGVLVPWCRLINVAKGKTGRKKAPEAGVLHQYNSA